MGGMTGVHVDPRQREGDYISWQSSVRVGLDHKEHSDGPIQSICGAMGWTEERHLSVLALLLHTPYGVRILASLYGAIMDSSGVVPLEP